MKYWLMKSEPDVWSIDQQKKAGTKGAPWDGVRNYQAAKNLKSMKKGDLCFFYHSNIGKEIVGIVEVIKEAYLDKTDKSGRFVAVSVKFKDKLFLGFLTTFISLRDRISKYCLKISFVTQPFSQLFHHQIDENVNGGLLDHHHR